MFYYVQTKQHAICAMFNTRGEAIRYAQNFCDLSDTSLEVREMPSKDIIMAYFRTDAMEELSECDRKEIMIACCSQSDGLEEGVRKAIERYEEA
jgi:undecaprenyl pyrophosphate synthase